MLTEDQIHQMGSLMNHGNAILATVGHDSNASQSRLRSGRSSTAPGNSFTTNLTIAALVTQYVANVTTGSWQVKLRRDRRLFGASNNQILDRVTRDTSRPGLRRLFRAHFPCLPRV